ncbi:hypothetical protein FPK58_20715 [Acinetobacter baumannii]|nr:hypothetical protein BME54_28615 [Klebsiella quasipneumoniae]AZJ30909.1 hypothetical protein BME36_029295 [Klebsiella quasipneumoniae subsp. similipneumoniae]MDR8469236.1 hypothetical protein [Acinetobacter baumannii]PXM09735.1 hypothetical protein DMT32_29275 [Klebsiella variicola]
MPENPASYRVVRKKSYLFNKAKRTAKRSLTKRGSGLSNLFFSSHFYRIRVSVCTMQTLAFCNAS